MSADVISMRQLSGEVEDANEDNAFVVDVDGFEGPLHLLLDLARKQKVDLLHVSILTLAQQYMAFIEDAKTKRIDLAADYLLMAAWLAFMKSRLLLPKPEKAEEGELSGEDMANRLAFRLKRLDAMRVAGEELLDGPILDNVVFLRGAPEQPKVVKTTEYDTTLWHLTQAFGAIRTRKEKERPHKIEKQYVLPLENARQSLRSVIPGLTEWASLSDLSTLFAETAGDHIPPTSVKASVFSATLELARDGDVDVRQDAHFGPLYLRGIDQSNGEGPIHDSV